MGKISSDPSLPRGHGRREKRVLALLLMIILPALTVASVVFYSGVRQALAADRSAIPLLIIGGPAVLICVILAAIIIWACPGIGNDRSRLSRGATAAKFCRTAVFFFVLLEIVVSIALALSADDYDILLPGFVGVVALLLVAYLAETTRNHLARLANAL